MAQSRMARTAVLHADAELCHEFNVQQCAKTMAGVVRGPAHCREDLVHRAHCTPKRNHIMLIIKDFIPNRRWHATCHYRIAPSNPQRWRPTTKEITMISQKSPSVLQNAFNSRQPVAQTPTPYPSSIDQFVFEQSPLDIDAQAEDSYWAEHFRDSPYLPQGTPYTHVRAAYRFGWESRRRLPNVEWIVALPKLRSEWNADPANFVMSWSEAEHAVRDAWNHASAQRRH
jgi:hypothetical protein